LLCVVAGIFATATFHDQRDACIVTSLGAVAAAVIFANFAREVSARICSGATLSFTCSIAGSAVIGSQISIDTVNIACWAL
jgi:hypothetical protein